MSNDSREWRCCSCGTLLGVQTGNAIECRYKAAAYLVVGTVEATCRRCGLVQKWSTETATRLS